MSGEQIFLVDGGEDGVVDLVRATDLVVQHTGLPVALIGGLAVTCRLATAHRPTRDVDLVAETSPDLVAEAGTVSANLISGGVARAAHDAASVRLCVGDTKVEIIETERLDEIESAGIEPERSRLFVVGHRWALESATSVSISVTDTDVEITVPVATASAARGHEGALHPGPFPRPKARLGCVGLVPPS